MFERTFGLFARVLIDIDLEKERLYRTLVERKGFAMFVDLDYEQIPDYCTSCRIIGHQLSNCRKQEKNDNLNTEQAKNNKKGKGKSMVDDFDKNHEVVNLEIEVVDLDIEAPEQVPLIVTNNPDASKRVQKDATENPSTDDNRAHLTNVENRNDYDLTKDAPEQVPLIATSNPGASKGVEKNATEIPAEVVNRAHLTIQYNEDTNDSSSQDSEFVDATQQNMEEVGSPSPSQDQKEPTPVRIQNDMVFLNESWANLAEQPADGSKLPTEEGGQSEEQRNLEKEIDDALNREDQLNLQASGFQLVTSKAKKKAQKTKNTTVKNNYETRSKPRNPRPFL